jgi:MBG domain (YGX type)/FG-GAP repeat
MNPTRSLRRTTCLVVLALQLGAMGVLGAPTSFAAARSASGARTAAPMAALSSLRAAAYLQTGTVERGAKEYTSQAAGAESPSRRTDTRGSTVHSLSQLPEGLAKVVRRTLARNAVTDYFVARTGAGYRAANPAQGLQIHFGAAGPRLSPVQIPHSSRTRDPAFQRRGLNARPVPVGQGVSKGGSKSWSWGMRLVGYGRSRLHAVAPARLISHKAEVEYRRGSVTEWYRNTAQGLEQGLTLASRQGGSGAGKMRLALRLDGGLRARLVGDGKTLQVQEPGGRTVLRYDRLRVVDARGRRLGAHMSLRGRLLELLVADGGARYPLQIDPYAYTTELNLGTRWDELGYSVAISGDGSVALLGAPDRTMNGWSNAGAGEMFTNSGSGWSKATELSMGASARPVDLLGTSVALSTNGSVALLGAPSRALRAGAGGGAGEVFTHGSAGWSGPTRLSLGAAAGPGDALGSSVALSGDGSVALLGAPFRTVNGQAAAGAGEVFTRGTAGWSAATELSLGAAAAQYDELGQSVALSSAGSLALLGAPHRTVNGRTYAGAGEVFTHSSGVWGGATELSLGAGAAQYDQLGWSVALSSAGGLALLGAWGRTVNGVLAAGAGEMFSHGASGWSAPKELSLGTSASGDELGWSVALSSNGDVALLGARWRTVNGVIDAGAGEIFTYRYYINKTGQILSGWYYNTELSLGTGAAGNDNLGVSAALSGDGSVALLGAPQRAVGGQTYAGAGEIFTNGTAGWSAATELSLPTVAAYDNLGWSVALSGDGNVALLGAPYRTVNGQTQAGAGEVFTYRGGAWSGATQLSLGTRAAAHDGLGHSVALSGDGSVALLGAWDRTVNGQSYAGAGEIFTEGSAGWSGATELSLSTSAAAYDRLGLSVALSRDGSEALLGTPYRTVNGQAYAGAGEVFTHSSGVWSGATELSLGAGAAKYDYLGWSVALSSAGGLALLGAWGRTVSGVIDAGAGEMFSHGTGGWNVAGELNLGTGSGYVNELGSSVALSSHGDVALLGAPLRTVNGQTRAGAGEIFTYRYYIDKTGHIVSGWYYSTELSLGTSAGAGDHLGSSVALSGNGTIALLAAPQRTVNGQSEAGAGEMFTEGSAAWSGATELSLGTNAAAFDMLGYSVALSGDGGEAVLGAPYRLENGQSKAGAAEVFAEPQLTVTIHASGTYGSAPSLSGLSPTNAAISYSPSTQASNVTGTLSCSTNATSASPVSGNPYGVSSCSGFSDPGYHIFYDYPHSPYTVTPAPLKLTPGATTTAYGYKPAFPWTGSGWRNGDSLASLTIKPTCTSATIMNASGYLTKSSGTYYTTSGDFSCGGAVDSNYSITYGAGQITANPAPLKLTPGSTTSAYGSKPAFPWTGSGWRFADSWASLTTKPTCSSATIMNASGYLTKSSGTYYTTSGDFSCGGGVEPNYSITYGAGQITATQAPLKITASSATITQRQTIPKPYPIYSGWVFGDTSASLTTQPTCSVNWNGETPGTPGTYATNCSEAAGPAYYSIAYVAGTLTINQ